MSDHHQYCSGDFHPDDIVISGISGRFPLCNTIEEFKEALMTAKHLTFETSERYEKGVFDLPYGSAGTISDVDKFDREYFGYSSKAAESIEPTQRMILEVSYEAIVDAGYDPSTELRGANIGVYTAISNEDAKQLQLQNGLSFKAVAVGYVRSLAANRCSQHFDFTGPSFTMDSACSSSAVGLWAAFNDIREGRVDAALVNAGQLCLDPALSAYYLNTGIVSPTCSSNPFDASADGIIRTEAVTAFFVQKASDARRAYATIMHIKHCSGGFVPEGLTVPSYKEQVKLFRDVLKTTKLDINDFQYIEAHGTGTQVGDPIEANSIATVYCAEGRKDLLYIGSVKSNVGHAEAPAGETGALKAILAFESGFVAPNYGFKVPNPNIQVFTEGKIKVVTEPLPFKGKYIPVNSFGIGGSFVQAMLKKNTTEYPRIPKAEDLPRLVLFPGNTEAAVHYMFDYIKSHPELRPEFFALLNKLSFPSPKLKPFRGYALFKNEKPVTEVKNSQREKEREVWFVMTGMGCQWPGMGLEMMKIKVFADSMRRSAAVLKPLGIDLLKLLEKDKEHLLTERSITPAFVAIAAIQIAFVDILRALEIQPDGILGHSTGELLCAYADGCCTAEQTILSAYWRGKCVESAHLKPGLMAAVGLSWEEAVSRCPENVYPACHNSDDSVTISGLKEPIEKFVAQLQKEGIFARVVNAYGFAFHCKQVWPAAPELKKVLSQVIRDPKPRTNRWISTSYPEEEWDLDDCRVAGPEYFAHNLMSTVRFNQALKRIPSDAITIEIGPHFLLQSILKRSIGSEARYIGLMKKNHDNNVGFFLDSLGKLYLEGLSPKIENLYDPVKFPVPRGTPQICDLIQWEHSMSYNVPKWKNLSSAHTHEFQTDSTDSYLLDHFIDGRSLFPATGYIWLAWQALAQKMQITNLDDLNVVVENFKIHRATIISSKPVVFSTTVFDCSGKFEITENSSLVASGTIYEGDSIRFCEADPTLNEDKKDSASRVPGVDIYDELRIAGYEYGPAFRRLVEASFDGKEGFVEWKDNWITFLDALLLFYLFKNEEGSDFLLPTGALSFKIRPKEFKSCMEESTKQGFPGVPVNFYAETSTCRTGGIEIINLEVDSAPQHNKSDACVYEEYKFVPYVHKYELFNRDQNLQKYMIACNAVVDVLQKNLKTDLRMAKFSVRNNIDFDVDCYLNEVGIDMKLLAALKTMVLIEAIDDVLQESKVLFSKFSNEMSYDVMNTLLVNEQCLRHMFEIVMENTQRKLNILELNNCFPVILPRIVELLERSSMLKFKSKMLVTKDNSKIDNSKMSECDIKLNSYESLSSSVSERSQNVVISSISVSEIEDAQKHIRLLSSLVDRKGFILLFHKNAALAPENLLASLAAQILSIIPQALIESWFEEEDLVIASKICDDFCGTLYLLRHRAMPTPGKIVRISENSPSWLDDLKASVLNDNEKTWVVSEDCPSSGIIGMINCLRHEPGGDTVRCVFVPQRNKEKNMPPQFRLDDPFFESILDKDLIMNIYKDGRWGSYRNVKIPTESQIEVVDHCYVNIKRYGDLTSFVWKESAMGYMQIPNDQILHIYYSALNFKDVMLATGKISARTAASLSASDDCVLGLEMSGRTSTGKRVMALCNSRGLATATVNPSIMLDVPDHWSLEEAATVPVVYGTCYYGLIFRANLQRGESILIHSGTGGIGLAAINIALSMECEIFTTVGTERKRKYIMEHFPAIKKENIGCSRDTSFETMIMKRTKGKGVNVVLNSLAGEKLLASIRCVSMHGRFVEIGKYDLAMNNEIGLNFFLKNISFHGVFLDQIMDHDNRHLRLKLQKVVTEGIKSGVVKPLDRTVFQRDEVEKAFRYMGSGTHIGKVLVRIREEEQQVSIPTELRLPAILVTYFHPHKVYIIIGGLGGFGIEVSKWLLQKGARNLVLTTRYGARTPYHHLCLRRWKDQGYNVVVSTRNVCVKEEASKLLKEASAIGPVGGIFNSAIVLNDAFLENTNMRAFKEVCAPKADATLNLDVLSRSLCPELDHFVCFSSISCGRGNAGQMNYGYANSVMERICEERVANGFPGLAIQWGIIGEVGVVHRHMGDDAMIAGVVAQRVKSCLNILDIACRMKRPVVSSYVVQDSSAKAGDKGDTLQQLARIFGFKDPSEFNSMRSFGEMGVDSMIGIEVKHLLESTCDISLNMKEIQDLKIEEVKAMLEKAESEKKKDLSSTLVSTSSVKLPKSSVHTQALERLNDIERGVPLFILDIDCDDLSPLRSLGATINRPVFALLWCKDSPVTDIESLASWYLERITLVTEKEAHVISHDTASALALEIAIQNQKSGKLSLPLTVINGYSHLLKALSKENNSSKVDILCDFVEKHVPSARIRLREQLLEITSYEQQVRTAVDLLTRCSSETVNKGELTEIVTCNIKKLQMIEKYSPKEKLTKDILLLEDSTKLLANDIAEAKLLLSEVCSGKISIQRVPDISSLTADSIQRIAAALNSSL